MSEWWTYSLSDFLLFSAHTYYRLFERYNHFIWPVQLGFLTLGAAIPRLLHKGTARSAKGIFAILAMSWLWVGWGFHLRHYASINWAATHFAAAFFAESALLAFCGLIRALPLGLPSRKIECLGLGIFLFALLAYPALAPLQGRPWGQAEIFGVAPDPTAIGTLGVALLVPPRAGWILLPIPLIWCAVSGATLWAMQSPQALISLLAAMTAVLLAFCKGTDS